MKLRLALLLITMTTLFAGSAQAGYSSFVPRWVTLYPASSAMGSAGYIRVVLSATSTYTQYYFCSTGATDTTNCNMSYLYNSDQLLALFHALQNAGANGQMVALPLDMVAPKGTAVWFGYP